MAKREVEAAGEVAPNFLGLTESQSSREASRVVVLSIPYEATTSYGAGTRHGPAAIIKASEQVELYDPGTRTEAGVQLGFHTLPALLPEGLSHPQMIAAIDACAAPLYASEAFVLALGGEHSVTVGLVRAAARQWKDLCIVQVDAHADLRDSWDGTPLSHACAARRALDELGTADGLQLVQIGIRNISAEGDSFRRQNSERIRTFRADSILADAGGEWLKELGNIISGRNLYLTFDLDGLDSAVMPATGTPEPGGLQWHHAAQLVELISKRAKVVAADIVELAPQPGNRAPDFLAAKLAYLIARRALGA
jgi:N1-aminopropylagmatine ureohydrolase